MNTTSTICTQCQDSDYGQVLIASWEILMHLLETSKEKVDMYYLVNLLLKAGVTGEQTMPLFETAVLEELEKKQKTKKKK